MGPAAAKAGLQVGDHLFRWSGVGPRAGKLEHWWQFELLIYTELARGPVQLERGAGAGIVVLPPRRYSFKAQPILSAEVSEALEALFVNESMVTTAAVEDLVDSLAVSREVATWRVVRRAEELVENGKLPEAVEWYQRGIELAPAPFSAELLRRVGELLGRLRRYEEADAAYGRGIALWKSHDPGGLGLSSLLSAQGSLRGNLLDLEGAREFTEEACEIRRIQAPGSWFLGNCLNNLGIIAARRNDLAAAEGYFLKSLSLIRAQGGKGERMLGNLGNVARLRGDFDRAESYTLQALEIFRSQGSLPDIAARTINLANIVGDSGDHHRAIGLYGEALQLAESAGGDPENVGSVYLNRGKVFRQMGDLDAAEEDLLAAKRLFGFEASRTSSDATIVGLLGEIAYERGQYDLAAQLLQDTLEVWGATRPDSTNEANTASALGRTQLAQGKPEMAEKSFRLSIDAIEKQQLRAGGGDRGLVAFRNKFAGLYRTYVEFLLGQGRSVEAFELYERSRAQALRALLNGRDLSLAVDEKTEFDRKHLARQIDSNYRAISRLAADATEDHQRIRLELEQLHAERDGLSQRLRASSPRLAAAEAPPVLSLVDLQKNLTAGTVVLAYHLGREKSTLFIIDHEEGLEAIELPIGARELAADIERWGDLILSPRAGRQLEARSRHLTRLLLKPAQERISRAERIVVVPDGSLHRLSFAALYDPAIPDRYLVQSRPIVSGVSVSVYVTGSSETSLAGSPQRVAVFGDPSSSEAAVARFRNSLGRLPAARAEAHSVGDVYGDRAVLYLDDSATETKARSELSQADITHFACHAVIDERLPLDSALVLAPDEGTGLLQAWEIAEQLAVASDLVVLSGCETAGGRERSGEGIVGLVRAFQIAGAHSVIASLWRVGDESTAALMERFYHHLTSGVSRGEALRAAQAELIAGPVEVSRGGKVVLLDASSPRHWAPFLLLGRAD